MLYKRHVESNGKEMKRIKEQGMSLSMGYHPKCNYNEGVRAMSIASYEFQVPG
jgi:hypothetical protein